jgi:ubiquinone/menaquinone biosynthesis C-methylase UbiE
MDKTKENWEYYGKNDPYYAVATFDKFRKENLTESNKDDFFQTGYEHIQKLWDEIEDNFIKDFKPQKGLDFGCGVGRITIPLGEKCEKVLGVDISELMLEEATRNCGKRKIENIKFLQTEEFLSGSEDKFDFIHSFIVFQHINPVHGEKILKKLIDSLAVEGIGVLHFTYANPTNDRNFWRFKIYRDYPVINRLKNLVKGTNKPLIPMYIYDLNKIFSQLQENDCHKCLVRFSFHGINGILIFFQKKGRLEY